MKRGRHHLKWTSRGGDCPAAEDEHEQLDGAALPFDNMTEAIMVTAADGRSVSVNKAFTRTTGFTAEELVGHPESEFRLGMLPPEYYTDMYAEVSRNGSGWEHLAPAQVVVYWQALLAIRAVSR